MDILDELPAIAVLDNHSGNRGVVSLSPQIPGLIAIQTTCQSTIMLLQTSLTKHIVLVDSTHLFIGINPSFIPAITGKDFHHIINILPVFSAR